MNFKCTGINVMTNLLFSYNCNDRISLRHPASEDARLWMCIGALDGGPQCRMSNLINDNVLCHHLYDYPVTFKIA